VTEVALIGLLALLTWKVTYDIASARDVAYGDEASWLLVAAQIPEQGLPHAQYCPLYCLWYRALALVQPDPVRLYYLSWQLLVGLLVLTSYLLCRAAGGTRFLALLAAFLVLNSRLLDVRNSYCGLMTAVLLMGGAAAAAHCRRWPWSLAVVGASLLLAALVRPECAVSFLLFGAVSLVAAAWTLFRRPGSWRGLVAPALVVLLSTAAVLRYVGNPLGGDRSFAAYCQWYAIHVVEARGLALNPITHYPEIWQEAFGDARTVSAAFRANPRALLWHFGVNLRGLPRAFWKIGEPVLALSPHKQRRFCWGLGALLLLGLAGQVRRLAGKSATAECPPERHGLLVGLTMLGFVLPPTLASCLVVTSSPRYLTHGAALLFVLLAAGLAHLPRGRALWARLEAPAALVLLGALLLALAPNRAHGWTLQQRRLPIEASPRPIAHLVAAVRGLSLHGTVTFLDYAGAGTQVYAALPAHFAPLWIKKPGMGFRYFAQQQDIGVAVFSPCLLKEVELRDDPEFKEFAAEGWADRFRYLRVPGTEAFRLAVRKDLLAPR
jgi:hypothetical protein